VRFSARLVVRVLFSSRRRHTRCLSDWSSDVCSSDLKKASTRSSCRVMSCGVPRLVSVEKKRRWRSPLAKSMDRNGAVEMSRSSEIGRASCRERVEIEVVAGTANKKNEKVQDMRHGQM